MNISFLHLLGERLRFLYRKVSVSRLCIVIILSVSPGAAFSQDFFKEHNNQLKRQLQEWYQERHPSIHIPTIPIEQNFVCAVAINGQVSSLYHYLTFYGDTTLRLDLTLDSGQTISGNGHYFGFLRLGSFNFTLNIPNAGTGAPVQAIFNITRVNQTGWQDLIRYFDATGSYEENGNSNNLAMRCQAYGHMLNVTSTYMRFECPDQTTAAGIYSNVFEFNTAAPGNVFRQRDYYPHISPQTRITERSLAGMYVQIGSDILMDFNFDPVLNNILSGFSDTNSPNAQLVNNPQGQLELIVNHFPPGTNVCHRVP